jgi:hypothetical protein
MAHGYLREYDEGWDRSEDRDRDDWRERGDRDWRSQDRDWRERDRDRGFMFDRDRDDDRYRDRDRDNDRGFFSRMGDEASAWFRDDEREGSRDRGAWENNRDWPQRNRGSSGYGREHSAFSSRSDQDQGRRTFSANPDDHYRSWRDRQMQSLDRDYADYCREREQQFHRDFDSWRQNRQQNRSGQGQQQGRQAEEAELLLDEQRANAPGAGNTPSPMSEATLGTNNSENAGIGRGGGRK